MPRRNGRRRRMIEYVAMGLGIYLTIGLVATLLNMKMIIEVVKKTCEGVADNSPFFSSCVAFLTTVQCILLWPTLYKKDNDESSN
jgi:hypothetical protein